MPQAQTALHYGGLFFYFELMNYYRRQPGGYGGGVPALESRFNVPLGGLAGQVAQQDPRMMQMAQARQAMLGNPQMGMQQQMPQALPGMPPMPQQPPMMPGMGMQMPLGMRPVQRRVMNTPNQMMPGAF